MEKKMGTYAAVEQNYLQKRRKNANPSGNTCPSLPLWIHLSFFWTSHNLSKYWQRFNTNYVSVLSSSLLGRVWGCQKHSRIRAECLHLTTQDKIPLLAYVEGKVTTIKRCLTNVLFVLNVHTILYVHSIYLKNNHYAIELINSIDFFALCLVWFDSILAYSTNYTSSWLLFALIIWLRCILLCFYLHVKQADQIKS